MPLLRNPNCEQRVKLSPDERRLHDTALCSIGYPVLEEMLKVLTFHIHELCVLQDNELLTLYFHDGDGYVKQYIISKINIGYLINGEWTGNIFGAINRLTELYLPAFKTRNP